MIQQKHGSQEYNLSAVLRRRLADVSQSDGAVSLEYLRGHVQSLGESVAKAKQIGPPKGKSSWSAITYSEYWSQRISFAISQCNAQAVLNAVKKLTHKQTVAELTQSTGGTQ